MSAPVFENTLRRSRAFDVISKDMRLGLGHAYMVVSPDDEIVKEFFTLVGAAVFCTAKSACMECSECRKVLDGNHPDLFTVNYAGEKIKVQEVKNLISSVSIKPLSGVKAYFVHRADLMTPDAQNKLLKTLEEPPEGVTIFLGAANEAGILDTMKSRCRKIYIDVFDRETVYNALRELGCDAESASIAAACCEGQLGKARSIAFSPEYKQRYSDALALLETLKKSRDILSAENIPSFRNGETDFLKILSVALRDVIAAKEGAPLFFEAATASRLNALAEDFSLRALALSVDAVNKAQEKLSYGVNSAAVCDSLLFTILEVKHKWQS